MKLQVQMLKGLPASGKSTYAKKHPSHSWTRINFDDLRQSLHQGHFSKGNEKVVQAAAYSIAEESLARGKHVIWDNTSFAPKHEKRLRELAKKYNAEFTINFFAISPEEAIKRDLKRENSVGADVIWDMYFRYCWDAPPDPSEITNVPNAVIVDLDGTLAHNDGHRGWYEWDKVGGDRPVEQMVELVDYYKKAGYVVIILSGRDGSCYDECAAWLYKHVIHYDLLFLRAANDTRPDTVIKREIYEEHIESNYRVVTVFDDRECVVNMWSNDLGLKVFQARTPGEYPNF